MKRNRHHVYPKAHRHKGTTERKTVNAKHHECWHILVSNKHPKNALRRIKVLLFGQCLNLTKNEWFALFTLQGDKTPEETLDYVIDKFLPTEDYYQKQKIGEAPSPHFFATKIKNNKLKKINDSIKIN